MPEFLSSDTKDDTERPRRNDRSSEHLAKIGEEGILYTRPRAVELISRPLFEAINEAKPPAAAHESARPIISSESLPSVSPPSQSEIRTYLPPMLAEAAQHAVEQAKVEVSKDTDDDDEDEEQTEETATRATSATAPTEVTQELQTVETDAPSLKRQFEEIMREAVGEDYARKVEDLAQYYDTRPQTAPDSAPSAYSAPDPAHPRPSVAPAVLPPVPRSPFENNPFANPDAVLPPPSLPSVETTSVGGWDEEPVSPPSTVGSPTGGVPPFRPGGAGAFEPNKEPGEESQGIRANIMPPPTISAEREKNHNGLWFVAGFITGWVVKQHLANKKMERMRKESDLQFAEQQTQMQTMAAEHRDTRYQLEHSDAQLQNQQSQEAAREAQSRQAIREAETATQRARDQLDEQRFGQPARPVEQRPVSRMEMPLTATQPTAEMPFGPQAASRPNLTPMPTPFAEAKALPLTPEQEQISAQEAAEQLVAKAYELQDGQHVELAAGGGHVAVVNEHGHVVEGAVEYGEEFKFQQRQEKMKTDLFSSGTGQGGGAGGQQGQVQSPTHQYTANNIVTGLQSGQIGPDHELPIGMPTPVTPQHLLPSKKENPVVATISSPWLWAAVIVLLVAFFTAAFI